MTRRRSRVYWTRSRVYVGVRLESLGLLIRLSQGLMMRMEMSMGQQRRVVQVSPSMDLCVSPRLPSGRTQYRARMYCIVFLLHSSIDPRYIHKTL